VQVLILAGLAVILYLINESRRRDQASVVLVVGVALAVGYIKYGVVAVFVGAFLALLLGFINIGIKKAQLNERKKRLEERFSGAEVNEILSDGQLEDNEKVQLLVQCKGFSRIDADRKIESHNWEIIKAREEVIRNAKVEDIVISEDFSAVEKMEILQNRGFGEGEIDELLKSYEKKKQQAKLRLVKMKMAQKIDEKYDILPDGGKREPIPEDVRMHVWRRDGGKCVKCGSNENLHFDHIIPFSKGGSSTERNLQLLCEKCNLAKSDKI